VVKNQTRPAPLPAASMTPGSPTGLGLGRLVVRLDGPRARVTDRETETVAGSLVGGSATRLVLYVNGMAREIDPDGRSFHASVDLRPGLNDLRAVATDGRGVETVDSITLYYAAPVASDALVITSPSDRHTVAPDEPPIVLVEGRVADPGASTVWLFANNRRTAVPTHEGRFRHALVVLEPVVRLWAQTSHDSGLSLRSNTLTVHGAAPGQAPGIVVLNWPRDAAGVQAQVNATWRPSPERLDHGVQTIPVKPFPASNNGTPADAFYLPSLRPGVYTFELQYRSAASTARVLPTLYLPEAGRLSARTLRPVALDGTGRLVLARVLLPQGVLWEQDDWFTGQSQTGDTITKFRFPEGISWTERKVDVRP
jgi:hypothetical protein